MHSYLVGETSALRRNPEQVKPIHLQLSQEQIAFLCSSDVLLYTIGSPDWTLLMVKPFPSVDAEAKLFLISTWDVSPTIPSTNQPLYLHHATSLGCTIIKANREDIPTDTLEPFPSGRAAILTAWDECKNAEQVWSLFFGKQASGRAFFSNANPARWALQHGFQHFSRVLDGAIRHPGGGHGATDARVPCRK